jgi:perosamine synthetase
MRPNFGEEEKKALASYMDEDGYITEFKKTEIFEGMIADFTKAKHCVVVNNGTISLTLAAMVSGIGANDEVIVPNYSMIATPNSIKMIGAIPIFVDVEPETLCMDIDKVKLAITNKTKAIMLVSANGRYPLKGITSFEKLAKDEGLILIEDAAQSLGSFYPDGRHIGRAGLIGSFSFSAPKIISTGQGGALITDNDEIFYKLKRIKDFGRSAGGNDIHDSIGYNFKFTELQAVIGIEQMKKLPSRVKRKKEIWTRYQENLKEVKEIMMFDHDMKNTCPWFIDVLVKNRAELINHLLANGIGTRVMYPPINEQKCYEALESHQVSKKVGSLGLWLPSSINLDNSEIDYICKQIAYFYKN